MKSKVDNPYKPLFALGIVSGVLGVIMWPLFNHQIIGFYPKQAHSQIMFFGFFWSFVAGFLMTAIPRMTGTDFASLAAVLVSIMLVCAQVILNYTDYYPYSGFIALIQFGFLLNFILPRFLQKKKIPFDGFLFFPAAFGMSILGVLLYYFYKDSRFLVLFSGEAFLTNLIVGLGSRLIPALSRLPNAFMHPGMTTTLKWKSTLLKVVLLNISFVLEVMGFKVISYILRILVVGYIAIDSFGIFKLGNVYSNMGSGLKISILFLWISYVSRFFYVDHSAIASAHILYIGGFTLLTLLIATRVTLAHSQTSLDYELRSSLIAAIIISILFATAFRWMSNYDFNGHWLYLSLSFFVFGLLLWLYKHLSLVRSATVQKD